MMIRVVAVDDHSVLLAGLKSLLADHQDIQLVATADHGSKLIDLVRQHHPDIAIPDLGMSTGKFNPVATVGNIKKEFPDVKVLVLTSYKNAVWARADDLSRRIDDTIQSLAVGGVFYQRIAGESSHLNKTPIEFTQQEKSALWLLVDEGKSIQTTAHTLGISEKSIHDLLKRMLDNAEIKVPTNPRIRLRHKKRK